MSFQENDFVLGIFLLKVQILNPKNIHFTLGDTSQFLKALSVEMVLRDVIGQLQHPSKCLHLFSAQICTSFCVIVLIVIKG